MKVIWKYILPLSPSDISLMLPDASVILDIQMQRDEITLWVMVDEGMSRTVRRVFRINGTGIPFDSTGHRYVGTVQDSMFVWHVFEVTR